MNKLLFLPLVLFLCLSLNQISAQGLSLGFKAGMSFSSFLDDSEVDMNGNKLESFGSQSGFHIGILGRYRFYDDLLGARFGLIYNQRGGRIDYNGPSYFIFLDEENTRYATGTRDEDLRWSNVFLDIPLEGMVFIANKVEISLGVYAGFMVGSRGSGDMNFVGRSLQTNTAIEPLDVVYEFRPFRDRAGLGSYKETREIVIDGRTRVAPTEAGTYFEFEEKDGDYFHRFDYGLTGGLTYFFNQGLYFNAQVKYGLADVVRSPYYVSKVSLDGDRNFIAREGDRRNFSLMFSLGFAF